MRLIPSADLVDQIKVGDSVTILIPNGRGRDGQEWKTKTGRAVMSGPAGWALNMGGQHGTSGVATERNIVRIGQRVATFTPDAPRCDGHHDGYPED